MKIEIDQFPVLMYSSFQEHKLKDCTVVVDAQNFFYNTYKDSKLPHVFGCECDRYAEFLKKYLSMFKKANVKCFFVFKGGHEDIESRIKKAAKKYDSTAAHFKPGRNHPDIPPILMKETYKQVLDEMGFDYVVCEYEAKRQCIALAQKLKCPIISFDKEFCFSNVPYIPYINLQLNDNTISCKIFTLDGFFEKYRITKAKFVIYIVLKNNCLPPSSLQFFFAKHTNSCNESLLSWLSDNTRDDAVKTITSCLDTNEREKFLSSEEEVGAFISRQEPGGVPVDYFEKSKDIGNHRDPLWFEKGVAYRYIAIPYINLYRSNILWGSWAIADQEANDAMTLSLDIVKYAYNLLTNFQKQSFSLRSENGVLKEIISQEGPITQRDQSDNVFQNGWSQVNGSSLFDNFLIEIFGEVPIDAINKVPEDAKLLMISLAYFSRMKRLDTMNEVYSIILSYIMLGVVQKLGKTKKYNIKSDCRSASIFMKGYFKLCDEEMMNIFDKKLLHPLVEFQHCLEHMNFLNRLCGSPYKPTIYKKTYNGTFVYKMLHTLKEENSVDGISFLRGNLNSARIVLAHFNCLIALYTKMI